MADQIDFTAGDLVTTAQQYGAARDEAQNVRDWVKNQLLAIGPPAGNDVYGNKVSAVLNPIAQGTDNLLGGVVDGFDLTSTNLMTTVDGFNNATDHNVDLANGLVNP
jgi:hypothetical protein